MNHDRMQTITAEMCDLLNEQTEWLKSSTWLVIGRAEKKWTDTLGGMTASGNLARN
jgi:hypothetical protein